MKKSLTQEKASAPSIGFVHTPEWVSFEKTGEGGLRFSLKGLSSNAKGASRSPPFLRRRLGGILESGRI